MRWLTVLLGVLALMAIGTSADLRRVDPPPPNILVFVTDDQRADHMDVLPQTMRRLGGGGTRFPNAFVTTPLCCPSRASIFSGRVAHNHGVRLNTDAGLLDTSATVQRYLRDAGYQTGIVGKYLDSGTADVAPEHFDFWAVYGDNPQRFVVNGTSGPLESIAADTLSPVVFDALRRFEDDDKRPWLLFVTPFAPHPPYIASPGDADADVGPLPPAPSLLEADRSDKPPDVRLRFGRGFIGPAQTVWTAQRRALLGVDRLVARVLDRVDALGEDDVLTVFTSDNGYMIGEHGITEDKRFPYTESVRVPLLLHWPGRTRPGAVDNRIALNIDLAPTILDAARVKGPGDLDGRSLLDVKTRRGETLLEYFAPPEPEPAGFSVAPWASLRSARQQYIEWYDAEGRVAWRELYDLLRDPFQMRSTIPGDIAADDPRVQELSARLARIRSCRGTLGPDACP